MLNIVQFGAAVLEKISYAFPYISLCKSLSPRGGAMDDPRDFIWTNLNLLAPRVIHAKYQCIPTSGSWEEDFWRFIKISLVLPRIGPQRGQPLYSGLTLGMKIVSQMWLSEAREYFRGVRVKTFFKTPLKINVLA